MFSGIDSPALRDPYRYQWSFPDCLRRAQSLSNDQATGLGRAAYLNPHLVPVNSRATVSSTPRIQYPARLLFSVLYFLFLIRCLPFYLWSALMYPCFRDLLFRLDPETAHELSL